MSQEYLAACIREIQAHGVTEWRVDEGHNHPRILFTWEGRRITHVVPGSPSDAYCGLRNNLAELRRALGVKKLVARKSARPRKKPPRRAVAVSALPASFEIKDNPFDVLKDLKERLDAA